MPDRPTAFSNPFARRTVFLSSPYRNLIVYCLYIVNVNMNSKLLCYYLADDLYFAFNFELPIELAPVE